LARSARGMVCGRGAQPPPRNTANQAPNAATLARACGAPRSGRAPRRARTAVRGQEAALRGQRQQRAARQRPALQGRQQRRAARGARRGRRALRLRVCSRAPRSAARPVPRRARGEGHAGALWQCKCAQITGGAGPQPRMEVGGELFCSDRRILAAGLRCSLMPLPAVCHRKTPRRAGGGRAPHAMDAQRWKKTSGAQGAAGGARSAAGDSASTPHRSAGSSPAPRRARPAAQRRVLPLGEARRRRVAPHSAPGPGTPPSARSDNCTARRRRRAARRRARGAPGRTADCAGSVSSGCTRSAPKAATRKLTSQAAVSPAGSGGKRCAGGSRTSATSGPPSASLAPRGRRPSGRRRDGAREGDGHLRRANPARRAGGTRPLRPHAGHARAAYRPPGGHRPVGAGQAAPGAGKARA